MATGLVQFAIAWNEPNADVDLEVTDPNGELAEVGRTSKSGLVKDRDCPGKSNVCRGQNMENVYLEDGDPARGKYRVRVRLEKLGGENPPISVTLGARVGPKTYALELELDKLEGRARGRVRALSQRPPWIGRSRPESAKSRMRGPRAEAETVEFCYAGLRSAVGSL